MAKKFQVGLVPLIVVLALGLAGCGDDDNDVTNPQCDNGDPAGFVVSPDTLYIDDTDPLGSIYLSTHPAGPLTWRVTSAPDWITVTPDSGAVNASIVEIEVSCDGEDLMPTMHRGRIEMISTGGDADVEVFFSVDVHPMVAVSDTALQFFVDDDELTLNVINTGTGYIQWTLNESMDWLQAYPDHGTVYLGETYPVIVRVDRSGLNAGSYLTTMTLTSNSEGGDIPISVTMAVAAEAILDLSSSSLALGFFEDSVPVTVYNNGNTEMDWSVAADQTFVSFDVDSGRLARRDSTVVVVSVDRTDLTTGAHEVELTFSGTDNQEMTAALEVNHFENELAALDFRVIDAEYDRNQDVVITVSDNPAQLSILDPETGDVTPVALSLSPTCVSIRLDGAYAAVGHNGYFSLVDLAGGTVEDTYAVTTNALDIVLAGNGFCYVFPRTDQWANIRCIDLATGVETLHTGNSIYAGTRAKLHPSGDYIYGADNGLSPSDFEKYDIRGGTAAYMYDSPYHGDYAFSGNIWISDDGLRLFARSTNVFRSSTVLAEDMTYNGNLVGINSIVWLDHSQAAGRVLVAGGGSYWDPPSSEIHVYDHEFLALQGTVPLPQCLVPDGSGGGNLYNAEGQFVFFNNAGDRFHVLVKAADGSGLLTDWATFSGDVADLP